MKLYAGYSINYLGYSLVVVDGEQKLSFMGQEGWVPHDPGRTGDSPTFVLTTEEAQQFVDQLVAAGVAPSKPRPAERGVVETQRKHIEFAERVAERALDLSAT